MLSSGLQNFALFRRDERNHFPTEAAIPTEILIEGEQLCPRPDLRQAHQTRVRHGHRLIGISGK